MKAKANTTGNTVMTPEQRRRNRRTGWILALFALAVLIWTFVRANLYGVGD